MASPDLVAGNLFRLYRETDTPGTYEFVCLAQTVRLTRTNEYEDATVPECDAPTSIPNRKSTLRSRAWGLSFSGSSDAKRLEKVETDFATQVGRKYQILVDKTALLGGKTYTGTVLFESLEIGKTNNGIVSFTATVRGEDALTIAAVA